LEKFDKFWKILEISRKSKIFAKIFEKFLPKKISKIFAAPGAKIFKP